MPIMIRMGRKGSTRLTSVMRWISSSTQPPNQTPDASNEHWASEVVPRAADQPERQGNGGAPQQGDPQVAAQVVGAGPASQFSINYQFGCHICLGVKSYGVNFQLVQALVIPLVG